MADAGLFATARRGGLTRDQVHEIEAHRARDRPTPFQALAARYGVPEMEIRALFPEVHVSKPLASVLRTVADATGKALTADDLRALADQLEAKT